MVRKVGFGRKGDIRAPRTEASDATKGTDLGRSLAKRLMTLALVETAGVAILIRGILTDNLVPIAIGIAWMAVVSLITLRMVLKFAGLRKRSESRASGSWKLEDDQTL